MDISLSGFPMDPGSGIHSPFDPVGINLALPLYGINTTGIVLLHTGTTVFKKNILERSAMLFGPICHTAQTVKESLQRYY
jgi:hypothetical protein